jgi:hypothetical protein
MAKVQMGESAMRHDFVEIVDGKVYLAREACEKCGFMKPLKKPCTSCAREKFRGNGEATREVNSEL